MNSFQDYIRPTKKKNNPKLLLNLATLKLLSTNPRMHTEHKNQKLEYSWWTSVIGSNTTFWENFRVKTIIKIGPFHVESSRKSRNPRKPKSWVRKHTWISHYWESMNLGCSWYWSWNQIPFLVGLPSNHTMPNWVSLSSCSKFSESMVYHQKKYRVLNGDNNHYHF